MTKNKESVYFIHSLIKSLVKTEWLEIKRVNPLLNTRHKVVGCGYKAGVQKRANPPYYFAIPPPFSCYQTLNVRADETNRLSLSQGPGFLSLGCCFIQGKQPQRPRVSEEAVYSGGGVGRGCLCAEAPIISFIYGGRKKSQPPAASSISHY